MKKLFTLLSIVVGLTLTSQAVTPIGQNANVTVRRPGTTTQARRPGQSTRLNATAIVRPFKGTWESTNETVRLDLYSPTVRNLRNERCYGTIETGYNRHQLMDEHTITQVLSLSANTARVSGYCTGTGQRFTATITVDAKSGKLKVKSTSSHRGCQIGTRTINARRTL